MENNGRSVSCKELFGLCDDASPSRNPAYIDEHDMSKWIGIVDNPRLRLVGFYGIDHCLVLRNGVGEDTQQVCDGLLHSNDELIFIELKDRQHRGWVKKACDQLIATVEYFRKNSTLNKFDVKAYVCNKQRPFVHVNHHCHMQEFKDQTGLELNISQKISL